MSPRPNLYALAVSAALLSGCVEDYEIAVPFPPDVVIPDAFSGSDVASLMPITQAAGLGTVVLSVPAVPGARDYRVFALESGVVTTTAANGGEHVAGAALFCAGVRLRNQCNPDESLPVRYNADLLDNPDCTNPNQRSVPTEVMRLIQVDGVAPNTPLAVEAIDQLCPFPGLFGSTRADVEIRAEDVAGLLHSDGTPRTVDVNIDNVPYTLQRWPNTFPVWTEGTIRAQYGSMIYNGQGPNAPVLDPTSPAYPESPFIRIAQPAPAIDPHVLARSVVIANPLPTGVLPTGFVQGDVFDGFDDPTDQPILVRDSGIFPGYLAPSSTNSQLYQTSHWNLFAVQTGLSQFFVDRGTLHMVLADDGQGVLNAQSLYPRRAAQLPSATGEYLYVTYDVTHNETYRRYEAFTLCGSDQPGQTYLNGVPATAPFVLPGYTADHLDSWQGAARTNPLGWNCLYLSPGGGGYNPVPGGDPDRSSDTSMAVVVAQTQPAPTTPAEYATAIPSYSTRLGPTQESPYPRVWERQIDDAKQISGVWLDDRLSVSVRTRFEVYVRRDRVVVYVNSEQRLCADLSSVPLTMAEGAIGLWHVLDHSSAEFGEIRRDGDTSRPRTGQHQILVNTPFANQITWDNIGFREGVTLPDDFDLARCW